MRREFNNSKEALDFASDRVKAGCAIEGISKQHGVWSVNYKSLSGSFILCRGDFRESAMFDEMVNCFTVARVTPNRELDSDDDQLTLWIDKAEYKEFGYGGHVRNQVGVSVRVRREGWGREICPEKGIMSLKPCTGRR